MKVCIIGTTHAPAIFREAARIKGLDVVDSPYGAELFVVAQDAGVTDEGERDLKRVKNYIRHAQEYSDLVPIILTSQVPPGFCSELDDERIYHQSETLRIKDALE